MIVALVHGFPGPRGGITAALSMLDYRRVIIDDRYYRSEPRSVKEGSDAGSRQRNIQSAAVSHSRIRFGWGHWRSVVVAIARRALVQLGFGALAGMTISALLLRGLDTGLGQIPLDSPVLVASIVTVVVVILIGSLACIVPTLRALKIAPTEALREGV